MILRLEIELNPEKPFNFANVGRLNLHDVWRHAYDGIIFFESGNFVSFTVVR